MIHKSDILIDRLVQHQGGILALLRGKEAMLRDPVLRDVAALARTRWALMRALGAYQLFKHNEVFDPAIAGRLLGAARATRLKAACVAMGEEFRGYVTKWSGTDVASEWEAYHPAALALIARLRDHIAAERREVESLLKMAA